MFGSYFFSILLHLALALLIFLWPSSPPVKLDQPMMQISVNMGAPGGNRMASPVLGPQGKPMPTKAAPQPAPAEQAASAVPVVIEDDVVIGANAVVLEGCRVGKGAVVAAGAVVVSDVAPGAVVAGVPAKVLKTKDGKTADKTALVDALREL